MILNFETLEPVDRYRLMIQAIVPRPIAWVLSKNQAGSFNLAPFSYFNALHSDPPMVVLSIGNKRDKSIKDTRRNIEREKSFVIHIASLSHAELVTQSSLPYPSETSEVEACGLDVVEWEGCPLPRLKTAKLAFACQLERVLELGKNKQGIVFGEIKQLYVEDAIATQSESGVQIDATKLDPLGRLGGNDYSAMGKVVTVDRPEYRPG